MSSAEGLAKRARDPLMEPPGAELKLSEHEGGGQEKAKKEEKQKQKKGRKKRGVKEGVRSLGIAMAVPMLLGAMNAYMIMKRGGAEGEGEGEKEGKMMAMVRKPAWHPPIWAFGTAWGLAYAMMGLASWLVWTEGGWRRQGVALGLYHIQLFLSLAWLYLFFGTLHIPLAMAHIFALSLVLAVCLRLFASAHHVAGNLIKPYLALVVFASFLNYRMWVMNRTDQP